MEAFDVVVLGTGAAALSAAVRAAAEGASVGLFEKADTVGGTSAWSGGMVWIPVNPHMAELGIEDSREEALTYLGSLSNGLMDMDLAATLVDAGPEVVTWLEENTPVRFGVIKDFPDYQPEHPGAKPGGGRSLECPLFPFVELGSWRERVTVGPQLSGNIMMSETSLGRGAPQGVDPTELERRKIRDERGAGQGLIGPLLKACLDRGIEPRTGMRAVELLRDGRQVTGVRFETAGGSGVPVEVRAKGGVDHRDRRFRVGPRARAGVQPRPPGSLRVGPDQYRRRPEDGDAGRRRTRQHARGVGAVRTGRGDMAARTPVLDKTDLFGTLPPELLEQLRGRTALGALPPGRHDLREGRPGDAPLRGVLGPRRDRRQGLRRPRVGAHRARPGRAVRRDVDVRRRACVRPTPARSRPSHLIAVEFDDVRDVLIRRPEVLWAVVRILARRLRATDEALADAMFLDVTGRTAKRLLELADGEDDFRMPLTQEELAGMVGASRERVNKAIALFVKLGWLEISGRSRYRIVNREELEIRATV